MRLQSAKCLVENSIVVLNADVMYLAITLTARGRESHNFSFNDTADNFPVCAHAVLGSPKILRGYITTNGRILGCPIMYTDTIHSAILFIYTSIMFSTTTAIL